MTQGIPTTIYAQARGVHVRFPSGEQIQSGVWSQDDDRGRAYVPADLLAQAVMERDMASAEVDQLRLACRIERRAKDEARAAFLHYLRQTNGCDEPCQPPDACACIGIMEMARDDARALADTPGPSGGTAG